MGIICSHALYHHRYTYSKPSVLEPIPLTYTLPKNFEAFIWERSVNGKFCFNHLFYLTCKNITQCLWAHFRPSNAESRLWQYETMWLSRMLLWEQATWTQISVLNLTLKGWKWDNGIDFRNVGIFVQSYVKYASGLQAICRVICLVALTQNVKTLKVYNEDHELKLGRNLRLYFNPPEKIYS
jgi:hypothetical protein